MSYHARKNIVTDGLVFSIDANNSLGGNSTDTKNLVNPSETGTFVNGTSVVDGEYDFDGVDDYIDFGNVYNNLLTDSGGNANFTATAIINPTSGGSTNGYTIIGKWGVFTRGIVVSYQRDNGYMYIQSSTNGVDNIGWRTVNSFASGQDYSVTFIVDNNLTFGTGARRIFVNGVEQTIISFFGNPNLISINSSTVADFNISKVDSNDALFYGKISNLKIYNRTLTPTEIQQNYEALKHRFE